MRLLFTFYRDFGIDKISDVYLSLRLYLIDKFIVFSCSDSDAFLGVCASARMCACECVRAYACVCTLACVGIHVCERKRENRDLLSNFSF